MNNRRTFIQRAAALAASLLAAPKIVAQQRQHPSGSATAAQAHNMHSQSARPPIPVQTPDILDLPFRLDNGVKEFHLTAEPVKQEVMPGRGLNLWGFNGSAPGPTIQINQGDRVRIVLDNHLPEPFSMHWHGFEIPHAMDGAPGTSQDPIKPGARFVYEFTLHQEGTFFYHSHMAMQEMMGMLGGFIMHPRQAHQPRVDKDFLILLQEYAVLANNSVPNSMNMEFNWLTFNGKVGPATTPLVVRLGDRVRIRLVNLGMDHHPIHLHGHTFAVTGTEAGRQPQALWGPGNTVLVGVAQARDIEFVANNPGDWMVHCHLPHHMMNAMSSVVGRMTRGRAGMPAGAGMEEGMGMIREGNATSEDNGPSLGRGMGVGATMDERTTNGPLSQDKAQAMTSQMQHGEHGQMQMEADVAPNANQVPGFPQDAYMEGPMMAMDEMVEKPENYGLRRGWSQFMQGMMTFVRVLPPDKYDEVMSKIQQKASEPKTHAGHGTSRAWNVRRSTKMRNVFGIAILTSLAFIHAPAQQQPQQPSAPPQMPGMNIPKPEQQMPGMKMSEPQTPSPGPVLRLEDLEQMGLANNPTLKQADAELRATEARKRQAGLYPNPTVGYQGEQIRGGSFHGGEQGGFIQQDIVLGGKLGAARNVVEQERKQAEQEREEQRLRILNGIRLAYYQALSAQETVALRTSLLKLAQDAVETSRQLFNVGQSDQPDLLQAEVEADQAELALTSSQQNQQRVWKALAAVVGKPDLPFSRLDGNLEDIPNVSPDEWLQKLLTDSPAIKIAQLGVARAEAQLSRVRREPIPDLQLRGGIEQNRELQEPLNQPVGLQGFAEIGVRIPLFNRNQGNIQAAKAEVERAQLEARRVQLLLRERLAPTIQNYLTAKAAVDRYRTRMIPRAENAYRLYLQKYNNMQAAYPQVLIAQRTLFQLKTDYVSALESVWMNSIALKGFMLTDGLEAPTSPSEIDRPVRETNLPTASSGAPR